MNQKLKRLIPLALNAAIRIAILYFLIEALLLPNDPRFAGKAIPLRNLIIVGGLSMLFPVMWWIKNRISGRKAKASHHLAGYPFGTDILYLSIFAFDMAGNSFNLYNAVQNFDLIAHFHGAGALASVVFLVFAARQEAGKIRLSGFELMMLAIGIATAVHVALEVQEYYTDVIAGTHNVGGVADTVNDLVAGLAGSFAYVAVAKAVMSKSNQKIRQRQTCFSLWQQKPDKQSTPAKQKERRQ